MVLLGTSWAPGKAPNHAKAYLSGGIKSAKMNKTWCKMCIFALLHFIAATEPREPHLATRLPQCGPKTAPRWPQDGPKRAMLASRSSQKSHQEAPGAFKMAPMSTQDATQELPRAPQPLKWPPRTPKAPKMARWSLPKCLPERPKGPQELPKWLSRGPKMTFKWLSPREFISDWYIIVFS